jgi:ribosomal protein S18 acetylase RimI-like enzyme
VRCSHYPQSPHFLDACDELGLLVWEEAPGWHNVSSNPAWQDLVIQNVRDMVIRDRSRPSVAIWGTRLNETPDIPGLWETTRQVAAELDGSRPSSGAMAFHSDAEWNEDVFAYNDYSVNWKTGDATLRPPIPGVPYLITESVGVEDAKPEYFTWTGPPEMLVKQAELHAQVQNLARSHPGYAGLLAWAAFDYASSLSLDPDAVKWAGVADGFRVPKPGAGVYQAQVDPAIRPVIVPLFFWELGGALPAPAPTAMIASNCDQLLIFIDGIQVASATPAVHSRLYGNLPYPPFFVRLPARTRTGLPELLIQGWVNGQQVTELRMSSDPSGDRLAMTADDPAISADGTDATRVLFRAVDAYGNQRRYLVGEVSLNLSGPGSLVGDNPFAFGEYGGLGAVWIRSLPGQPGPITVTATHRDLGQAQVLVQSQPVPQTDQVILLFALKLERVQRELTVSELGPGEFTARLDQVISVYAAAMRPAADTLTGRRSIMAGHAAYPGFRALTVTADDDSGEAVGFGYGFRGAPGQWWHDTVARALAATGGARAAAAWLDDTFEVAELHVAPGYQGSGIGSGLLLRLTSGRPERTAVLSTRDAETRARRLYRGVGFTDLLTSFSFYPGSEPPYAVMGAELPLRALPPGPGSARLRWPSPSRW